MSYHSHPPDWYETGTPPIPDDSRLAPVIPLRKFSNLEFDNLIDRDADLDHPLYWQGLLETHSQQVHTSWERQAALLDEKAAHYGSLAAELQQCAVDAALSEGDQDLSDQLARQAVEPAHQARIFSRRAVRHHSIAPEVLLPESGLPVPVSRFRNLMNRVEATASSELQASADPDHLTPLISELAVSLRGLSSRGNDNNTLITVRRALITSAVEYAGDEPLDNPETTSKLPITGEPTQIPIYASPLPAKESRADRRARLAAEEDSKTASTALRLDANRKHRIRQRLRRNDIVSDDDPY